MCTLVGLGEGLRLFLSFSSLLGGLDLERERRLLSCLRREGLGEPEELLELELRDVLELPERLDAEEELEPLLEPVLVLEPELEVELDRDLVLLLPLEALRLFRVLSLPRSFSLDSLVAPLSLERSLDFSSERSLRLVGEGALVGRFTIGTVRSGNYIDLASHPLSPLTTQAGPGVASRGLQLDEKTREEAALAAAGSPAS